MKNPLEHPLFEQLRSFNFNPDNYTIFGSGPMWIYGLRESIHDVDILARGDVWEQAKSLGRELKPANMKGNKVELLDGAIEIFNEWGPGEWNTDKLIEESFVMRDLRFVQLHEVLKWKQLLGREKDIVDIRVIEKYLLENS